MQQHIPCISCAHAMLGDFRFFILCITVYGDNILKPFGYYPCLSVPINQWHTKTAKTECSSGGTGT